MAIERGWKTKSRAGTLLGTVIRFSGWLYFRATMPHGRKCVRQAECAFAVRREPAGYQTPN